MGTLTGAILLASTSRLAGFTYGTMGRGRVDCTQLTYGILLDVYGAPAMSQHPALMVYDRDRPWSPVEGAVAAGIGTEVNEPTPGRWHLCQGWQRLTQAGHVPEEKGSNGHAWLWYQPETPTGLRGYIVQATTTPPPWCTRRTWSDQCSRFPAGVHLAELRPIT